MKNLLSVFRMFFVAFVLLLSNVNAETSAPATNQDLDAWIASAKSKICKHILPNGLTVLFYKLDEGTKVDIRVVVNFGSRDEKEVQFGFAHMIEHMIFKGTPTMSETDLMLIAEKFGKTYFNAFTSKDTTVYMTMTDNLNWPIFLAIFADCIENTGFNENHFSSEVKAVISEMNLYRKGIGDQIFSLFLPFNHPYTHSVVGTREALLSTSASDIKNFYKQNYTPEKTTLVVVGNIDKDDILKEVNNTFGHIQPTSNPTIRNYNAEAFIQPNSVQKNATMHTQIEKPYSLLCWATPGARDIQPGVTAEAISYILNERLLPIKDYYSLVFDYYVGAELFLDLGFLLIQFTPKTEDFGKSLQQTNCVESIKTIIQHEITDLALHGPRTEELNNFKTVTQSSFANLFVSPSSIASVLTSYFINNNEYIEFDKYDFAMALSADHVKNFCKKYLKPSLMNQLNIVPLQENEKAEWVELQGKIDEYEATLLSGKNRETKLDGQKLLNNLPEPKVLDFVYDKPDMETTLSNGLKVYIKRKTSCPDVCVGLSFKNPEFLDLSYKIAEKYDVPGLALALVMEEVEGNRQHPEAFSKKELNEYFDSLGAQFSASDRVIICNAAVLEKVIGMALHVITHPTYPQDSVTREINNDIQRIKSSKDDLQHIVGQEFGLYLYQDCPWLRNDDQSIEQLKQIKRQDFIDFNNTWIAPQNMFLTVVGNIDPSSVADLLERVLGGWKNENAENIQALKDITFNDFKNPVSSEIVKPHPDEQILLVAGRLSVTLGTDEAVALTLISDYLTRKLFEIREQSGLFYYCSASTNPGSYTIKGLISVQTEISPDKLDVAKNKIKEVVNEFAQTGIPSEDLVAAKNNIRTNLSKNLSTPYALFSDYRYLLEQGLSFDHYKNQIKKIDGMSLEYVNSVVRKYFNTDEWTFVVGGRV